MKQIKTVNGSSMLYKMWYDEKNQVLRVKFRKSDTCIYEYAGIRKLVVRMIQEATSPGKMFRAYILLDKTIKVTKIPA